MGRVLVRISREALAEFERGVETTGEQVGDAQPVRERDEAIADQDAVRIAVDRAPARELHRVPPTWMPKRSATLPDRIAWTVSSSRPASLTRSTGSSAPMSNG